MRAIVLRECGPPDVLRIEEVERPMPERHEVLIEVAACGVCTLDVVMRNGTYRRNVSLPCVPGHEIAGVVVAVGDDVRDLCPGDRVATTQRSYVCGHCRDCRSGRETLCEARRFLGQSGINGGYTEAVAVGRDNVARLPASVPFEHGAIAACAVGTSLNAVRDAGCVRLGESVLVTGAGGGVGIHAVKLARLAGAWVIAQTTSGSKAELIARAGAHEVLVTARGEDFAPRIRAMTRDRGVDVVIDNVGTLLFEPTRQSLANHGRWVLVGQLTGDFVPFSPARLFLRDQSMISVHSTSRAQLEDVLTLMERGTLVPEVSAVHDLAEVASVHASMERGSVAGRVVLRIPRA